MSLLRNLSDGLRWLCGKQHVNREFDEELSAFLEMAAQEKMKHGMSSKDVLRAREFGSYQGSGPLGWLGMTAGNLLAGSSLRCPRASQIPRLHRDCRPYHRTRHGRKHGNLQRGARCPAVVSCHTTSPID